MPQVILIYLNNETKEHKPDKVEVTDGMLVMDWIKEKKRVIINTLNLGWIEINDIS